MVPSSLLKRATLLGNLKKVIQSIPAVDLPVYIRAIYAFGGILRDKNRLHDCDLLFLYSMSKEQEARWERFRRNFSTWDSDSSRHPLAELRPMFEPFIKQQISLREAVNDPKVAQILSEKGVPPLWAGCFSWTEITQGRHGDGIFYPDLDRIIRRILIGKKIRGLQTQIDSYKEFMNGHTMLAAKNYVLAWSPEKPNIEENIEGRQEKDKIDYITKELTHFIGSELPRARNGDSLTGGYLAAKEAVSKKSAEASINIDLAALEKQHAQIKLTGNESYEELKQKCEIARCEMRKYMRETKVLESVDSAIETWLKLRNDPYFKGCKAEEFVARWVIENTEKNVVKEADIREILKILSLPQDQVITIKGYGFTYYRLPEGDETREKLLKEANLEKQKRKYLINIMKAVNPIEKNASARIQLNDDLGPKALSIEVYRSLGQSQETERDSIMRELQARGFKVQSHPWAIYGIKGVELTGKENIRQLQEIARKMLTMV